MKNLYKVTLVLFVVFSAYSVNAQNPVATLQHAGATQVFYGQNSFVEAYNAAVSGDTLNLSVGGFTPPKIIEKGITIIGAGYLPDSISIKKRTSINGPILIFYGSDKLHLEGLFISDNLNIGGGLIDSLKVIRCRFIDAIANNVINHCSFEECIVEGQLKISAIGSSRDFLLSHCIINNDAVIPSIINTIVDGNIFLKNSPSAGTPLTVSSAIVRNNIFLMKDVKFDECGAYNNFYNNLLVDSSVVYGYNTVYNYSSNDYCGIAQSDIFINQTGNSFDYAHNYHLKNPEKFIGTDGTQVGLYGGLTPFKDGGAPSNPQVISKTIARETDTEGNLKVDMTVKAQEN